MNKPNNSDTSDLLDRLMQQHQPISPPDDFSQRVMQHINAEQSSIGNIKKSNPWWQKLALTGASLVAASQVASFILSAFFFNQAI